MMYRPPSTARPPISSCRVRAAAQLSSFPPAPGRVPARLLTSFPPLRGLAAPSPRSPPSPAQVLRTSGRYSPARRRRTRRGGRAHIAGSQASAAPQGYACPSGRACAAAGEGRRLGLVCRPSAERGVAGSWTAGVRELWLGGISRFQRSSGSNFLLWAGLPPVFFFFFFPRTMKINCKSSHSEISKQLNEKTDARFPP